MSELFKAKSAREFLRDAKLRVSTAVKNGTNCERMVELKKQYQSMINNEFGDKLWENVKELIQKDIMIYANSSNATSPTKELQTAINTYGITNTHVAVCMELYVFKAYLDQVESVKLPKPILKKTNIESENNKNQDSSRTLTRSKSIEIFSNRLNNFKDNIINRVSCCHPKYIINHATEWIIAMISVFASMYIGPSLQLALSANFYRKVDGASNTASSTPSDAITSGSGEHFIADNETLSYTTQIVQEIYDQVKHDVQQVLDDEHAARFAVHTIVSVLCTLVNSIWGMIIISWYLRIIGKHAPFQKTKCHTDPTMIVSYYVVIGLFTYVDIVHLFDIYLLDMDKYRDVFIVISISISIRIMFTCSNIPMTCLWMTHSLSQLVDTENHATTKTTEKSPFLYYNKPTGLTVDFS
jgi:hypothetical protein